MFNSSIPSFVQVDCDLVVGLSSAAEGDELAEGISWSDTQDSGRPSGAAQSAPAADRRGRAASCSDDEVLLPSTAEDSPPARAPSRLRPRPARSSPPPPAESAARRAAPPPSRPDHRAASPTVAGTSVAASSLLQARRHVGASRIFSRTFNRRSTDAASISSAGAAAAATTVTSKTPVERSAESGQCGDGDGGGDGDGDGDGGGGDGDGPDDWPPSAARLSPVLGTQLSPVLRPSRSPVLRPTRRHPSADASAARVSKHTTGLSTDGTAVSGGEAIGLAPTAAQSEAHQSCTQCDAASGGIPSTASSPVIERRRRGRRGRRRANSDRDAAATDSAVSAATVAGTEADGPELTDATRPATECTSGTPLRSRPAATAGLCGEDGATGRRAASQTSALSPPVSRRSAGATRRQSDPVRRQPDPVRRLFPAADDSTRASKRRRASLAVDEALRARQPPADPVPTVASQERLRWLSEVTADRRPAPPPPTDADGDRRASDFVRRLRAVPPPSADTAPSATAEPPAPESGGKGAGGRARRGGLVHRLRRLLARSTAFARMSRHSSGGRAAPQGALRVLVERCDQQAGARLVLGTSCAAGPAVGRVLVLLAAGGAPSWPAVARGDTLLLHPPWQRLQPAQGAPVLLPIGGASVEPGSPSPPQSVTLLEFSCPCPKDIALQAKCVRPYPRVRSPLRQPQLTQSHLTTVREAVNTDSPLDDTTIMSAIGCGGDVVNTIDANVLHVCQYRCPADSQASDGPEEDWCWSLLVRDGDGTLAELVLPAALVRRHRALVRRGARLRLSGLVVRERTTSDRCPALASLIVRLSGGGDPGFTYILQALLGHSQLAELSADTADTGADTGSDSADRTADRTAGCRSAPPPDVGRRLDLTCRVLAPCEGGGALVLPADGDGTVLHLQRRPEAALLPAAGQTASLTQLWSPGDGQLVFDRYSLVEQRDGVDVPPPETPLRPLTTAATPLELVLLSGHVAGVDEQCASIWTACSACFSDDLTETPGGHFCHFCCRAPPSTVIRMELKVEVACADVGRCRVFVQLLQSTIEALLAKSSGDGEQGYELSSMLGHELTDLSCVVVSRQPQVISLHQVRL